MKNSRFAIAVHTLALMANCEGKPIKSECVAALVKTNAVVIRRLLCELSRAGLIESQSGACGGSRLKKQADDITLWEIFRAVETGEVFSLHNPSLTANCKISSNIGEVLLSIQSGIEKSIEKYLSETSLSDVLRDLKVEEFNEKACQEKADD